MVVHVALPPWLGIVLIALGSAILLTSSKIVMFNSWILERLNNWFLNIVAKASGVRYALDGHSVLWKGVRFSYWVLTLLVGVSLVTFGIWLLKAFKL